jgi:serine/threonine protein kinase
MPLAPDTKLGPYVVVEALGAGGMGEVYRARDTRLDRDVAIKVLPPHLSQEPTLRQRMEREAKAISGLNHPNICTLHDIGRDDGIDYLVMEYLQGETLGQRFEKGPLGLPEVFEIAIQIADALDAAHKSGIVHRDLKPANVMLTASGAKLLDFGLAKINIGATNEMTASPTMTSPLTTQGTLIGTFQYMAPEQLEGAEADARSDIFAFGMVLYEMATGHRVFEGKTQAAVIAKIMESEPVPPTTLQPLLPPALGRLIETCLAKQPDQRWQTAADLKRELQWISEAGSSAGVPAPRARKRRNRERILTAAVVVLALAAVALSVLHFGSPTPDVVTTRTFVPAPPGTEFYSVFQGPGGAGPVAISPDGRQLTFVARDELGDEVLYVRPLDALESIALAGTKRARYPFWSPDSRTIAFFSAGKLRKVSASGGPVLALCDAPDPRAGSWGSRDVIVFAPDQSGPLHRVAGEGGPSSPVTVHEAGVDDTHRWPWFLPDGKRFLYFVRDVQQSENASAVKVGSIEEHVDQDIELMKLPSQAIYASGHLLYVLDGTLMAHPFDPAGARFRRAPFPIAERVLNDASYDRSVFAASDNGVLVYEIGGSAEGSRLVWFDRDGRELGQLGDPELFTSPRLSPDGRFVAVQIENGEGSEDLWIHDIERNVRTRFTFDPTADTFPVWSPDGVTLAFASDRTNRVELYVKSVEGSEDVKPLLVDDTNKWPWDWSRDGRFVLYSSLENPNTGRDIWVLPLEEGTEPWPLVQTEFMESEAMFSADGRWVAYRSRESGEDQVYVIPFPGPGRKSQISIDGGSRPRWNDDGTEIVYLNHTKTLVAVVIDSKSSTLRVGAATTLFQTQPASPFGQFDATGDLQRFLVNQSLHTGTADPLVVVQNWTAEIANR